MRLGPRRICVKPIALRSHSVRYATAPISGATRTTILISAHVTGQPLFSGWLGLSLLLYVLTGLFWLPVVWIQARMRDLAGQAAQSGEPLPPAYDRLFRIWFACGFPAFGAVLAIIALMVIKPAF